MENFKRFFRRTLTQVSRRYQTARLKLDQIGPTARNSPPPVGKRLLEGQNAHPLISETDSLDNYEAPIINWPRDFDWLPHQSGEINRFGNTLEGDGECIAGTARPDDRYGYHESR